MKSITEMDIEARKEIAKNIREGHFDSLPCEVIELLAEIVEPKKRGRKTTGISEKTQRGYNRALVHIDKMREETNLSLDEIIHRVAKFQDVPFGPDSLRRILSLRRNGKINPSLTYVTSLYEDITVKFIYDTWYRELYDSNTAISSTLKSLDDMGYKLPRKYIEQVIVHQYDTTNVATCKTELDFIILICTAYVEKLLASQFNCNTFS